MVAHPHAGHSLALAQKAHHGRVGGDRRAQRRRGARDGQRVAGVVDRDRLAGQYAAGLAKGFWTDQDEVRERWAEAQDGRRGPRAQYARWKKAVERSMDWTD